MTPTNKISLKSERQIRALQTFVQPTTKRIDSNFYVEGYAARFEPYVLWVVVMTICLGIYLVAFEVGRRMVEIEV